MSKQTKKEILLIGGGKGGVGKSSLSQTIAVYLKQLGKNPLIIDADPQKTSRDWVEERRENPDLPNIPCIHATGDIRQDIKDALKSYDYIIIDPCGIDPNNLESKEIRSALSLATRHLVPLRPKRRDLKTLRQISSIVDTAKIHNPNLICRAVITQCPSLPNQAYRILEAKEACKSYEISPLSSITMHRNSYDDCDENGCSVLEYEDEKAKEESIALIKEFLEI
ncbi:MAG: AAA family ATPase [Candidatus Lokiarchaeota archaeon]|nr:AAA family ATPase [Candidatus Lokiarchaeota archaeon]